MQAHKNRGGYQFLKLYIERESQKKKNIKKD